MIWYLKTRQYLWIVQLVTKAINALKQILKVSILDAMKLLAIFSENVTKETIHNCSAKESISTIDQTPAQYDLNHPLINLRSNIEKLKALDLDEIPQDLFSKYYEFWHCDSDEAIISMVTNNKINTLFKDET